LCPLWKKISPTVTAAVAGAEVGDGVLGGGVLGGGVLGELGDVGVEALSSPQPTTRLVASIPPSNSSIV
jgi:hypothetical protein